MGCLFRKLIMRCTKASKSRSWGQQIPSQPTGQVVLTVGVVISHLGVPDGVPAIQHGHTLGQQQGGQNIPLLFGAKGLNVGIVGRPLDPAIPTAIVVVAVPIIFAVGFVVFFVVAD